MDKRATVMDRGTDKMNETACTREIRIGKQEESERETQRENSIKQKGFTHKKPDCLSDPKQKLPNLQTV